MPLPPYQRPMYDDRGSTARMSDLILRRGQIQADLALRQGDTSARLAQNLGSIASGTMADLVSLSEKRKADQRQARLDDEAAKDRAQRRDLVGRQIKQADDAMATQATKAHEERSFNTILGRFGTREGGINWDEAEKEFAAQGMTHLIPRVREYRGRLEKEAAELQAARLRAAQQEGLILGLTVDTLKATGGDSDPTGFALGLGALTDAKVLSQEQALRYWQQVEDEAQGDPAKASAAIQRIVQEAEQAAAPFRKAEPRSRYGSGEFGSYLNALEDAQGKPLSPSQIETARGKWTAAGRAPASGEADDDSVKPSTARTARATYERAVADINADEATQLANPDLNEAQRAAIRQAAETRRRGAKRAFDAATGATLAPSASGSVAAGQVTAGSGRDMANRPERDTTPVRPQPAPADPRQAPPPQAYKVGDLVTKGGQLYRVTKVYPDGSIDAQPTR